MDNKKFIKIAKTKLLEYYNKTLEEKEISINDIYVVWICKTLQNNKALLATTNSDNMYFEITYNGDNNEMYLDAYKKYENKKYFITY